MCCNLITLLTFWHHVCTNPFILLTLWHQLCTNPVILFTLWHHVCTNPFKIFTLWCTFTVPICTTFSRGFAIPVTVARITSATVSSARDGCMKKTALLFWMYEFPHRFIPCLSRNIRHGCRMFIFEFSLN